jgi:hypothetical protein
MLRVSSELEQTRIHVHVKKEIMAAKSSNHTLPITLMAFINMGSTVGRLYRNPRLILTLDLFVSTGSTMGRSFAGS